MAAQIPFNDCDVRLTLESTLKSLSGERFDRWHAKNNDARVVVCSSGAEIQAYNFGPNWATAKEAFQYQGITFYRGNVFAHNPSVSVEIGGAQRVFPYTHFDDIDNKIGEQSLRIGTFMRGTSPKRTQGLRSFLASWTSYLSEGIQGYGPVLQLPSFDE